MNFDLDPRTVIAALLGLFFIVVAMSKNFGKKKNTLLDIPGMQTKVASDEKEVKFSDPFDENVTPEEADDEPKKPEQPAFAQQEQSSFKEFVSGTSDHMPQSVVNDSDYQWE